MNNFPKPQYGNSSVGFIYFQNAPSQPSSSGTGETLDYIEFTNTPNTTTGFQPGYSSSPQQFRQRNSNYHKANRNKNYRQFHSDVNYQEFSPNQNQNYNPRGNYSPRARGRGNFSSRGNFNSRGNYRNQNKNRQKSYNRHDIRQYVTRSMVENPWKNLMCTIKIHLKSSDSSISTVTSGDSNSSDTTVEPKSTNSDVVIEENVPAISELDKKLTSSSESVVSSDTTSTTLDSPES